MTSWQKIRLFFSPLKANPWGVFWIIVYVVFIAFSNTYIVVILQSITKAIEIQNSTAFWWRSFGLMILFGTNYIVKIFYKPRNFGLIRDLTQYLEADYLQKFLQSNNNETEKI